MRAILFTTALMLLCLDAQSFAANSPLDARAAPDHPTIRSELRRAHVASGSCGSLMQKHSPGTSQSNLDVLAYLECMDKIIWESAENGTYSDAFEVGIDFQRVLDLTILLPLYDKDATLKRSETMKTLQHFGRVYFDSVNDLSAKIGVSPNDICEGAGWVDCQKSVVPRFSNWASMPK